MLQDLNPPTVKLSKANAEEADAAALAADCLNNKSIQEGAALPGSCAKPPMRKQKLKYCI